MMHDENTEATPHSSASIIGAFIQVHDIGVFHYPVLQEQPYTSFHLMEALPAGRARVEIQHVVQFFHTLNPQDVAVPADENIGPFAVQHCADSRPPSLRMASDVMQKKVGAIQVEPLGFPEPPTYGRAVDISKDAADGRDGLQLIKHIDGSYIAGVEDQVYVAERLVNRWMEISMCVRDDTDAHQRNVARNPNCARSGRGPWRTLSPSTIAQVASGTER